MAKRGKSSCACFGRLRKAPTRRRFAPPDVDLKKQIAALKRELTEAPGGGKPLCQKFFQIIGSTPGELKPVFEKMLRSATRVCGAKFRCHGPFSTEISVRRKPAGYNLPPAWVAIQRPDTWRPHPPKAPLVLFPGRRRSRIHLNDLRKSGAYLEDEPTVRALSDLAGARTIVTVPMLKEDELIGAISIFRQEVKRPFTDKHIALVSNFANQAVIVRSRTLDC